MARGPAQRVGIARGESTLAADARCPSFALTAEEAAGRLSRCYAAAGPGTMLTNVRFALPLVLNSTLPSTSANKV